MFFESIIIALDGLRTNKLRSILTMLGIIIGVGAVITMVTLGAGVKSKMEESFASLGSNLLVVTPGAADSGGAKKAAGTRASLTYKDAQAIMREVDGVNLVAPVVMAQFQMVYNNQNWIANVQGVTPGYLAIRNLNLDSGDFISQENFDAIERVVVLGQTTAENLFRKIDPIGKTISINRAPFKVIGLLSSKGQSAFGSDQDDTAFVPITTAQERLLGINFVHIINIQAIDEGAVPGVEKEITELLHVRHRIPTGDSNDFTVNSVSEIKQTASDSMRMITLFLGTIAAISLLVGGALGILLGYGAAFGLAKILKLLKDVDFKPAVDGWSVAGAVGFSIMIGLFFGIYPARKAARLDPIEALRYE